MVHVLRVSGMPGGALIWVRVIGFNKVVYCDKEFLLHGTLGTGPWKTGTDDKGRESGT